MGIVVDAGGMRLLVNPLGLPVRFPGDAGRLPAV